MVAGCNGAMEPDEEKKKLNDDLVVFMRKRSETDAPRYVARLKTYVDLQQKHRRAGAARRHYNHGQSNQKKKADIDQNDKVNENSDHQCVEDERMSRRRATGGKVAHRTRSLSHRSGEPEDCGCRRRRRRRCSRRRPRRRSRRRRRSCRRRPRRRSRSRRRRRRSCRRRRRRRRRR